MNLQSKIIVSLFIITLIVWCIRLFARKQLNSGQAIMWFTFLGGAEILTLFPSLVDCVSTLWGNLFPVSWITFVGLIFIIACLLTQSVQFNNIQSRQEQLARHFSFLEERLRKLETHKNTKTKDPDDLSDI